jgi:N-acetyltransferase 10
MHRAHQTRLTKHRYALADGGADWEDAERQILNSNGGSKKSTTVSVKRSGSQGDQSKRKGVAVAEALKEVESSRLKKKPKRTRN